MAGRTYSDASHRVFVAPRRVRFRETEYAMPLEIFGEVVREVERAIVASGEQVTFPMEVRTAAADDTWLGSASGRESVYVAVHRYHRERFAPLAAVEPVFQLMAAARTGEGARSPRTGWFSCTRASRTLRRCRRPRRCALSPAPEGCSASEAGCGVHPEKTIDRCK